MNRSRWKAICVASWAALTASALALPALVDGSRTVVGGFRAAVLSALVPWMDVLPLGLFRPFLGLLYPLLAITLFGIARDHAIALGAGISLFATMLLWGLVLPAALQMHVHAGVGPPDALGVGYWVWLASGACLIAADAASPQSQLRARLGVLASGYLVLAVAAAVRWRIAD